MKAATPTRARRPDAPEVFENYRGHRIGNVLQPFNCKNPISGHEWTEHQVMSTLKVSGPANFSWHGRTYRSLKAAKSDIDYAIKYDPKYQLSLSPAQAVAVVRSHFVLDRDPSTQEIEDLVVSLRRKQENGTLDDGAEMLCIQLGMMDEAEMQSESVRERQR